jgi:hypothetical protein
MMTVDPGQGYIRARLLKAAPAISAAATAVINAYGPEAPAVIARAISMASQSWTYQEEAHLETYSLLHRIFEETSATIQDLLAAGVRPSLVEFLAEATPRPGNT